MREITLKINVEDGEVKVATASLERMKKAALDTGRVSIGGGQRDGATAAAAKRLGISYEEMAAKVKGASGASKEAAVAIAETGDAASSAAKDVGVMGGQFGALLGRVSAVGAALAGFVVVSAAVIAAMIAIAKEVFSLAKGFADYVRDIRKASEETGLATETIVALRQEATATGRDFGAFTAAVDKFREQIGKAAAGSDEARRALNTLGIDGKKAINDIDAAFTQAVKVIGQAKNPVDQIRLAYAAFGTDGAKILPFIRAFGGDIDALKKKAEELGIQIGGKNVQQADAFSRAYAELQAVIRGIANTFGQEFLPAVTNVLRDFGRWLVENKGAIKDWAEFAGEWIEYAINRWRQFFAFLDRSRNASQSYDLVYADDGTMIPVPKKTPAGPAGGAPINANQKFGTATTIAGVDYSGNSPDPVAQMAAIEERNRRQKAAMEEAARQAKALAEFIKDLEQKNKYFGDTSEVTAAKIRLEALGIRDLTSGLGLYALQVAAGIDKKKADADADKERKKALEEYQKALAKEKSSLLSTSFGNNVDLGSELRQLEEQIRLGRELNAVEAKQITQVADVLKYRRQLQDAGLAEGDINNLVAILEHEQERTLEILKQVQAKRDLVKAEQERQQLLDRARGIAESLEDEITVLSRGGRELSRYEELMRELERDYAALEPREKQRILDLAKQADLLEELNRQHAELKDFFAETFTYVFDGDFSGLLESFRRRIVDSFVDNLSNFLATEILGFDPNATDNPVAKPIVGKLETTNKLLGQLVRATGQSPATSGLGSLGSIFSGLFGGGGGGSIGPGGTPYFNPNSGGGSGGLGGVFSRLFGGGGNATGSIITLPNGEPAFNVNGSSGGGFFSRLTGPGGIFGSEGLGNNVGTYGAVGAGAGLLGNLIGGRVGRSISSAGAGLALGAQIGSIIPGIGTAIGAVVGGIAGFFAGLFGGDPKRKRDKNEKIPALNKGFTDAFAELRKILEDIRFLRIEPDDAISRANEVRAQIAGGFGIQFESKKYRKQAQQKIQQNLATADGIIAEIRTAAEIARGAADRRQRILPEFAGGTFVNGLLPGVFDGRDNIFAMLSRGEMVLNPRQQNRVRSLAGFDVFAGAGIPNYPNPSPSPKMATGGIAGAATAAPNIVVEPQFTVIMDGVSYDERSKIYLQSADGRRTLAKVIKEEKKDRRIS